MAQFVRNLAEKAPALVNAAVTYSKPRLATFWYYAKVELVPPTPAEIPTAIQSLKKIINSAKTGSFKQLTVKPYGLWSARLLCSWDSPGKNTGVGCHAFPRDLPDPGTEPKFLISLALAGRFFTTSVTWEAPLKPLL
uniref:ATP synthase membrane subunit g n=1 Tax=Bos taurus TaxID=9913 RepID=A0AAA9RUT4_BOVIN